MGKFLVTQADYALVVGSNPSFFTPTNGYALDLTLPVETAGWSDASNYCAILTAQELAAGRIPVNFGYRLPTEAEWEYACRARSVTRFFYGDDPTYASFANYFWDSDNSGGSTHSVAVASQSVGIV